MRRLPAFVALAVVVLAVASLGALAFAQVPHEEHAGPEVSIGFGDFSPPHLDVLVGETVTWRNDSVRTHTVTANDGSWDSGRLTARGVFRHRFDEPGPVGYFCRLHVIPASLHVHSVLLDESPSPGGPGLPRELSGRTAAPQGTEIAIEADAGAGFAPVATVTAEEGGSFHTEIRPRETTRYRAVVGSEASPAVTVVVLDRRVTVSARRRGRRTLVTARVTPPSPGVSAVLQLRLAHRFGWWPVARTELNRASRARFVIRRGRRHTARVILTLDDGATLTAKSPRFQVGHRR